MGKTGCLSSNLQPLENLSWTQLQCGSIGIRLLDEFGEIEGVLQIGDEVYQIPKSGLILPRIDGFSDGIIWSGMNHDTHTFSISSDELMLETRLNVFLSKEFDSADSFHIHLNSAPNKSSRSLDTIMALSSGLGSTHHLIISDDIVHPTKRSIHNKTPVVLTNVQVGLNSNFSTISWPWRSSLNKSMGAIDHTTMSDVELLNEASGKNRLTAVTKDQWDLLQETADDLTEPLWTLPDFILYTQPTFIELQQLCTWNQPLPLGIWSWFEGFTEPNRPLLTGNYSTGNGPHLQMNIGLQNLRTTRVSITGSAATWMGMTNFEVWSEDGLELDGEWGDLAQGIEQWLPTRNRYCLIAWGTPVNHPFHVLQSWAATIAD